MSDQREYRKWRASIEALHGWDGVTFRTIEQYGKVIGAEAWKSTDFLGLWPSKPQPTNLTGNEE